MAFLDKLTKAIATACMAGAGLSFVVLIAVVLIQVVGRAVGSSAVWTEELTRFALLYMAAFGVGLSFRSGNLVNVDLLCENLPRPLPWILRLTSALLTATLALALIPNAWRFTVIGKLQTSPALGLRMDYVHFSLTLLLSLLALFAMLRVAGMLLGSDDGLPLKSREG